MLLPNEIVAIAPQLGRKVLQGLRDGSALPPPGNMTGTFQALPTRFITSQGRRLASLATALALTLAIAIAQVAITPDKQLDQVRGQLDQIEASLVRLDQSDAALQSLRSQLEPIALTIEKIVADMTPRLDALKSRLDQLAPKIPEKTADKPAEKPGAENPAISAERAEQDKAYGEIDATLRRARALAVETEQMANIIQARRRAIFTRALFERSSSLLNPGLWMDVLRDLPHDLHAMRVVTGDWIANVATRLDAFAMPLLASLLAVLALMIWPLAWLTRRFARIDNAVPPGRFRRILAAWGIVLGTAFMPFVLLACMSGLVEWFGLYNGRVQPLFLAMAEAVVRIAVIAGLAQALLNPAHSGWRLLAMADATARRLARLAIQVALVLSLAKIMAALAEVIAAALPVVVVVRGIGALIVALVVIRALRSLGGSTESEECLGPRSASRRDFYGPLRLVAWTIVLAMIAAVVVGYVAFAAFLADQVAWVFGVAAIAFMAAVLAEEGLSNVLKPGAPIGRALISAVGLRHESLQQIAILLSGAGQMALAISAVLLVLAPWGVQSDDFAGSLRTAFFGFKVGDVTISLADSIIALGLFGLALGFTRALQRWLDKRFLPATQLDPGLRNSIRTSLGYLGFVLAASLALAHLGLSFEKLAIVAGALSVGIGFGLQSIVNNFVSGLILLWERAIRVGDWIVVGEDQGYVRRINVRATEIETFDRLTVIVPNSSLVSGVVKNWVRGDRIGRLKISISLSHDMDVAKARECLIASARAEDAVVRIPAPSVLFSGLTLTGASLDLLCFVEDVETSARVRSDLMFDIHARFKAAGLLSLPAVAAATVITINGLEHLRAKPADAGNS